MGLKKTATQYFVMLPAIFAPLLLISYRRDFDGHSYNKKLKTS
jgi:hypothetical protein